MFFLVLIQGTNAKKLVPSKWIKNLETSHLLNYGMRYHKKKLYTVFYSPFISTSIEPDFTLTPSLVFSDTKNACYKAFLLKIFSKFNIEFFIESFHSQF